MANFKDKQFSNKKSKIYSIIVLDKFIRLPWPALDIVLVVRTAIKSKLDRPRETLTSI